jgi:hypothetical protein
MTNGRKMALLMRCAAMVAALGASACMEDSAAPQVEPPAVADGATLSAEQRAELEANPELQALRARLERSGEVVSLDDARAFEQGDKLGIVAPVSGADGQSLTHSQVVLRQGPGRAPRLSLELAPTSSPAAGELRDEANAAAGVTCGAWTPWARVSQFCDWAVACWFGDATYNLVERFRQCCAGGVCRTEGEVSEQRVKCGC